MRSQEEWQQRGQEIWERAGREIKADIQRALDQIEVGARYRSMAFPEEREHDIIVTFLNPTTRYVAYRKVTGPGMADFHRNMWCLDFVQAFRRRRS